MKKKKKLFFFEIFELKSKKTVIFSESQLQETLMFFKNYFLCCFFQTLLAVRPVCFLNSFCKFKLNATFGGLYINVPFSQSLLFLYVNVRRV